ncbi:hypothetical protein HanRHA438_Chr14g0640231 [Helianthus annuus]|nr:hypothetical protein HanIR_Chr14g0682691 [Helianthus annuus]KAJ0852478.1 hypothetical protein HanRHA438_Chr14g0640231 [Helianthus annuus]
MVSVLRRISCMMSPSEHSLHILKICPENMHVSKLVQLVSDFSIYITFVTA